MKTSRIELQDGMKQLSPYTNKGKNKSTLPIVDTVLCQADDTGLIMTVTDLYTYATVKVAASHSGDNWTQCIDTKGFAKALRTFAKMGVDIIEFIPGQDKITLSSDMVDVTLDTLPSDEFPPLPKIKSDEMYSLSADDTYNIKMVSNAASDDEARPVLNSVNFNGQQVAAANGYSLSYAVINMITERDVNLQLLPMRKLPKGQCDFTISEKTAYSRMIFKNVTLHIRHVEGKFPPYRQIVPNIKEDDRTYITFEMKRFFSLIDVMATKGNYIKIDQNGLTTLSKKDEKFTPMTAKFQGGERLQGNCQRFGFDPDLVQKLLKGTTKNGVILIQYTNATSPALVTRDKSPVVSIIMPIHLDDDDTDDDTPTPDTPPEDNPPPDDDPTHKSDPPPNDPQNDTRDGTRDGTEEDAAQNMIAAANEIAAPLVEEIKGPQDTEELSPEDRARVDAYKDGVIGKLKAEGLTINSPWAEIEAVLSLCVGANLCIRIAKLLRGDYDADDTPILESSGPIHDGEPITIENVRVVIAEETPPPATPKQRANGSGKGKAKMSADDATKFKEHSGKNAQALADAAEGKGCDCVPYVDWFTFDRWAAQGLFVQKGQKGIRLFCKVKRMDKKTGENRLASARYRVFCRCQVKTGTAKKAAPTQANATPPQTTGKRGPKAPPAPAYTANTAKMRATADNMDKQIEGKLHPAIADQNPTPRRIKIVRGTREDGAHLQMIQGLLRRFADQHDAGTINPDYIHLTSKAAIERHYYKLDRDNRPAFKGLADIEPVNNDDLETKELLFEKIPGYFPTPEKVIDQMIERADIEPGSLVLEPSAGDGRIADRLKSDGHRVEACETYYKLRGILERKGHKLVGTDFLDLMDGERYDAIVMNPPFERGADRRHVMKAYGLLKPGGTLVSIMANGASLAKFQDWLDNRDSTVEKLPSGSFEKSGTGVDTVLVTLAK